MKTFNCLCAAIVMCLMSGALLAQQKTEETAQTLSSDNVTHLGTLDYNSGNLRPAGATAMPGDAIWENNVFTGSFRTLDPTPGNEEEVIDAGDLPSGTEVGAFEMGIATDSSEPVTVQVTFYQTDAFGTTTEPLSKRDGTPATYDVVLDGLPGGLFGFTVNVRLRGTEAFIIDGDDLDGDGATDWGYGYVVTDPGNSTTIGALISGEGPAGAPGRFDAFDLYQPPFLDPASSFIGTPFFGGDPFAQFHMALTKAFPSPAVPTMNSFGLLGMALALMLGAGLFLRRRA